MNDWIDARRAEIDRALARILPAAPGCPPPVGDAMRYILRFVAKPASAE